MDLVPYWPTTIKNSFDIPDFVVGGQVVTPGQAVPLHQVIDRDNVYILVNDDNDDYDPIPADPSSNYPDDRFETSGSSVLRHDKDDDAVMVRIAFPAAEHIDSGTLELRTSSTSGIDSRIALYHAADRNSDGVLLTPEQLSIDLANPDASNPLKLLAEGEEVKIFVEGVFALQPVESIEVALYLTLNGTETKLSSFTLKLLKTDSKSMRFVAHSSVGAAANGWTKDRMQDSSNVVRRDKDFEGGRDRMVPINFRRRDTIPIDSGDGTYDLSSVQSNNTNHNREIRLLLEQYGAQCYVTDQITNAGGWSMNQQDGTPWGRIVVPYRTGNSSGEPINTDKGVIAHEWLHAFANEDHKNIEHNLMWGTGPLPPGVTNESQMVNRGNCDEVTEDQKNAFVNNDS